MCIASFQIINKVKKCFKVNDEISQTFVENGGDNNISCSRKQFVFIRKK